MMENLVLAGSLSFLQVKIRCQGSFREINKEIISELMEQLDLKYREQLQDNKWNHHHCFMQLSGNILF